MSYHQGFLYLSDFFGNPVEIVNEYRTKVNIQRALFAGVQRFGQPDFRQGCTTLGFAPCTMASNGTVTEWAALNTATNAAPWWSSVDGDASSEALGFFVEEWTGLDGGNITRASVPRGNPPYGSAAGLQTQSGRVMAINLIAVGTTERGLQHLLRWLTSTLAATCSPCESQRMWTREFCPAGVSTAQLEDGLLYLDEVSLAQGPTWEAPPVDDAGCFVRRLSFTLVAGDPCLKRPESVLASGTAVYSVVGSDGGVQQPAPCALYSGSSMQTYAAVTSPATGYTSPVVTISSTYQASAGGSRYILPFLRIVGFADDASLGSFQPCSQRRIGMITVGRLPAGYELVVDCATGSAIARDLYGDRLPSDGGKYLVNNVDVDPSFTGRRRIAFDSCRQGYVVVEPALLATAIGVTSATAPSGWTVSIDAVTRMGCL